jgi:protein-L-isoaspartate(D-aspartate) O-methyltransferase
MPTPAFAAAVEGHLRRIGVRDPAVIRAVAAVDRAAFVPEEWRGSAEDNAPLPIGHGQTISAYDVVGYMTAALGVGPGSKVLDVGTGCGYQAAVLAERGCRVFTVEIVPALAAAAAERLRALGYAGVRVRTGDGRLGWPEEAPFDGIVAAAAAETVPPALVEQLAPGARLVLPVGLPGEVQHLVIVERDRAGRVSRRETLPVRFVPMTAGGA